MHRNPLDWEVKMAPGGSADDEPSFRMDYSELVELDSGGLVIYFRRRV